MFGKYSVIYHLKDSWIFTGIAQYRASQKNVPEVYEANMTCMCHITDNWKPMMGR